MSLLEFYLMLLDALAPWLLVSAGILVIVVCVEIDHERQRKAREEDDNS